MSRNRPLVAIVDDDESVCRAMKRLVRSLQFDADAFHSGTEFLEALEEMPVHPDCVILDLQMPGMDGLAVQSRLALVNPSIPVIFITAHDEGGARSRAFAAGAIGFLRKPFDDALLADTMSRALAKKIKDEQ